MPEPDACAGAEQRFVLAQVRLVSRRTVTDRNAGLRRGGGDRRERAEFHAQDARVTILLSETASIPSQREAIVRIGKLPGRRQNARAGAIGHRVVHGGPKLRQHCLIDDAVLQQLEAAIAFAPLHIPPALSVIRFAQEHFPGLPQVGMFRHHVPRRLAGCCARPSDPQGTAIGGYPALRLSRPFLRIDRASAWQTICPNV